MQLAHIMRALKYCFLIIGFLLVTYPGPQPNAAHAEAELMLTDFTADSTDLGWYVVNDNVMGGRSLGEFELDQKRLSFSGHTNTDGGGFSSIRTQPLRLDLSAYAGIQLRIKGDGRRYTWRLTTNASWRGRQVSYWADFETSRDKWTTVKIPFDSFIPQFRGFRLDGPAPDLRQITGMGLMIYDKRNGPFDLQLASVHAYSANSDSADLAIDSVMP